MEHATPSLRIVIGGRLENLDLVDRVAGSWFDFLAYPERERDRLVAAVHEAAVNGVQYAARERPGSCVTLEFTVTEREAVVEVTDDGPGFDPGALPDPRAPDQLLRTSGRGILIMRAFTDAIDFDFASGTRVTLRKALVPGAPPSAAGARAGGTERT